MQRETLAVAPGFQRILLAVCLCLLSITTAAAATPDYLPPDLRERVEKLKVDVALSPTTPINASQRLTVLWDWANAFALSGRYVPVNLIAATRPNLPDPVGARAAGALDSYVRELSLYDEEPDAIGDLSADLGPFEARSWATLQQTYTVGARGVLRGGGIVVAKHQSQ